MKAITVSAITRENIKILAFLVVSAAVGLGLHPDYATAVAAMARMGDRFEPEPEHAHTYDQLFRRVYCRMYKRLQPLYRDIRAITGYPSHD